MRQRIVGDQPLSVLTHRLLPVGGHEAREFLDPVLDDDDCRMADLKYHHTLLVRRGSFRSSKSSLTLDSTPGCTITSMNHDTLLTMKEVLGHLRVNRRTVYRLIKAGEIPALRVGRLWRFRKSDLDTWLESHQLVSAPAEPLPQAPAESVAPVPVSSRPRVLVVDDEASIRDLLSRMLALAEYDVDVASNGRSAVDQMQRSRYNLLIVDLRMPGMDGMAVVKEARRLDADLPVVIITAHPTEATAIEAVNLGVSGFLMKPFAMPKLLEITAKALGA